MTRGGKSITIWSMAENVIPGRVREFIIENIDSVAELEALLLLRQEPQARWTVPALAGRLYTSPEQAEEVMAKLHLRGLSEVNDDTPPSYRYQPASAQLDGVVGELSEAYSRYLIPVTNLIHSKPRTRIRQFADAFKLGKRRSE
jgi:hypothetical protein